MSQPNPPNDNPILAAWHEQLARASKNPFLLNLLLKQWQRVLKRLAYFYAQLASLPRRNRRALQRALATSLIGAAMLLALSSAPVAFANSITVSGACELGEAITNANNDAATFPDCAAGSGADTIYLTADVTLGGTLPNITSEITLEGGNFFVSGANTVRVFHVTFSGDFTINDTTVKEGYVIGDGGGIFNDGTLELNNSTVSGNTAIIQGGGIYNNGTLVVNNSTFSGNFADYGAGIFNDYNAILNDSTVSGNTADSGGGIYNTFTLTLNTSTVSGNSAMDDGGGIYNKYNATLNNSTVSGNSATDDGGGIYNRYNASLNNSTVSGNSVGSDGGGIFNGYFATLNNSTISGNSASYDGGGIYNKYYATLNNSTVSGNTASDTGGGIYVRYATLYLNRTIVSGNTATNKQNEIDSYDSTINAHNYNLFGNSEETNDDAFEGFTPGALDFNATSDGDGVSTHIPTALASILNTTLALNGGTTENHALVTGSPALDKAPNADCSIKPIFGVDQRGFPRNVDFVPPPTANDCDIGAFELQLTTAVNVTGVRAKVNDAGNIALKWRTTTETQIAGFNVWRKNGQGEWKQINVNFKQAKHSGDAQGDKYRYVDKKVKDGNVYRYKIEVKYLDGHHEWTDVVRVEK